MKLDYKAIHALSGGLDPASGMWMMKVTEIAQDMDTLHKVHIRTWTECGGLETPGTREEVCMKFGSAKLAGLYVKNLVDMGYTRVPLSA